MSFSNPMIVCDRCNHDSVGGVFAQRCACASCGATSHCGRFTDGPRESPSVLVCRRCQWRRVRDYGPLPFMQVSLASDTACSDCGFYVRTAFYLEDAPNV